MITKIQHILRIFLVSFVTILCSPYAFADGDNNLYINTVVIDAGHGGHDPGCISANKKIKEKDICLSIAKKLGNQIKEAFPGIKIIYTRDKDVFVPLNKRAEIANAAKANLFISIHVNAAKSKQPRGTETFVMGMHKSEENLRVCMQENSVVTFEEDYKTKYAGYDPQSPESFIIFSLLQNAYLEQSLNLASTIQNAYLSGPISYNRGVKQGGLLVLCRCTMPSVLTEVGFLSNATDYKILTSLDGQTKIAKSLFKAFCNYKKAYEKDLSSKEDISKEKISKEDNKEVELANNTPQVVEKPEAKVASDRHFSVQIFALSHKLLAGAKEFKGYKNTHYIKVGQYYKYHLGSFTTEKEASEYCTKVKKSFPNAFVICIEDNKIVKFK